MIDIATGTHEAISAINPITMQSNILNYRVCTNLQNIHHRASHYIFYDASLIKNDGKIMHDRDAQANVNI